MDYHVDEWQLIVNHFYFLPDFDLLITIHFDLHFSLRLVTIVITDFLNEMEDTSWRNSPEKASSLR